MGGWCSSILANVVFDYWNVYIYKAPVSASLLRFLTESCSCVLQSVECRLWCNEGDTYATKIRL